MRIARLFAMFSALVLVLGLPPRAHAQDAGKTGLTIDYPGAIGIIWHASDAIAVRPDVTFSHASNESTNSDSDGFGIGFDLGVLFYTKKLDNVRTYVSPRFSYTHSTTTLTPTTTVAGLTSSKGTTNATGGAGTFGAQFTPTSHFAVYGEVGIGFTHHKSTSSNLGSTTSKGNSWGTVAGVGIVFYP